MVEFGERARLLEKPPDAGREKRRGFLGQGLDPPVLGSVGLRDWKKLLDDHLDAGLKVGREIDRTKTAAPEGPVDPVAL
jgi:hypothetical protein